MADETIDTLANVTAASPAHRSKRKNPTMQHQGTTSSFLDFALPLQGLTFREVYGGALARLVIILVLRGR